MTRQSDMQEKVRALIERHCDWLRAQMPQIERELAGIASGHGAAREDALRLRERVHQITGSSGTMGFAGVSAAARELEAMLEEMAEASGAPADGLAGLVGRLAAAIAEADPHTSQLYNAQFRTGTGANNHAW